MMPAPLTAQRPGQGLLTVVLVVAALSFGQGVLMPLALAVLFAFLLTPVVNQLQHWGCNRGIAVALTTLVSFALIGALLFVVILQMLGLIDDLPLYRDNLLHKIRGLSVFSGGGFDRGAATVQVLTDELQKSAPGHANSSAIDKVEIVAPSANLLQVFSRVFGPLVTPAATAATVVVFVIFMLLQREDLRDRVVRLFGTQKMSTTLLALDDAAERVSRYLLMQLLINGLQGTAIAVALYFIGVPDALLWGALTVVLRFIPYLGPIMAAMGPIAMSIAFFDNWTAPLLTVCVIVTFELITNNVLEPRLYGSRVGVSALALIVAAVFWTWLWGIAGLFLAIPLTVCLVVLGKYIPQLEFLSIVLSDQPVLEPRERFYQRLLADDLDEAEELLAEAHAVHSLAEQCDTILLPALRFAEQDHDRGAIDEIMRSRVVERIGVLVDALLELEVPARQAADETLAASGAVALKVLCVPAGDAADELAARLFSTLLQHTGIEVASVSITTLASELLDRVEAFRPDVICISSVPPSTILHARYLCKRVRSRFATIPIVVGLWNAQGDLQKARERLTSAGATRVVDNAALGLEAVELLLRVRRQEL